MNDRLRGFSEHTARFTTPSVLSSFDIDAARCDISISVTPAGSMIEHTGMFADVEALVAAEQEVDRAFLMPSGSTGANHTVLRAIDRGGNGGTILVDRQAHHSVIRGLNAFCLPWRYIDRGRWDAAFETPTPVLPEDVAEAISTCDDVAAVIVVSPTYAGEIADLAGIRAVIDDRVPEAHFHVDEAWGSHLAFHPALRPFRAARWADSISQSVHKQAGALQPGAVLLYNDGPIAWNAFDDAYVDLMSTSASFLITASIDHAYRTLRVDGESRIERMAELAQVLGRGLLRAIPGSVLFSDTIRNTTLPTDPTKVTVAVPPGPVTGYELRDALIVEGIVVEKATPATVTFLMTFQIGNEQVRDAIAAAGRVYRQLERRSTREPRGCVRNPFAGARSGPMVPPSIVQRSTSVRVVDIDDAIGHIAAEYVEAYPPGVAIISEGFEVTVAAIESLRSIAAAGGGIVGRDPLLRTLRILDVDDMSVNAQRAA